MHLSVLYPLSAEAYSRRMGWNGNFLCQKGSKGGMELVAARLVSVGTWKKTELGDSGKGKAGEGTVWQKTDGKQTDWLAKERGCNALHWCCHFGVKKRYTGS